MASPRSEVVRERAKARRCSREGEGPRFIEAEDRFNRRGKCSAHDSRAIGNLTPDFSYASSLPFLFIVPRGYVCKRSLSMKYKIFPAKIAFIMVHQSFIERAFKLISDVILSGPMKPVHRDPICYLMLDFSFMVATHLAASPFSMRISKNGESLSNTIKSDQKSRESVP